MPTSVFILLKEFMDSTHIGSVAYINGTDEINSDEFIAEFKSFMEVIFSSSMKNAIVFLTLKM